MNLLLRVGFMIKVSLFYKDSSAKGGITDLRGPQKMFHRPLAPSSAHVLPGLVNAFLSELGENGRLWQRKLQTELMPQRGLAENRAGERSGSCASEHCAGNAAFPHRFPGRELQLDLMAF